MEQRLRSVCDLMVPEARDLGGRHDYDGVMQDVSAEGVARGLERLGGPARPDPTAERHLCAFEDLLRATFGRAEMHRRSPRPLLDALDVSAYDRDYARAEERAAARRRHLAAWPEAIDAALPTLDAVPAETATALLPTARGLETMVDATEGEAEVGQARAALQRLISHLQRCAESSEAPLALGGKLLAQLHGSSESVDVDLGRLEERADAECDRLTDILTESCAALDPGTDPGELVIKLGADHPSAEHLMDDAQSLVDEVIDFTRGEELVSDLDGECHVAPSPPNKRWATAMMAWSGPEERDGPSLYYITPPNPEWAEEEQREWLGAFSRTTLPTTTAHEVAPGHFAHSRVLRRVDGDVARTLHSPAFVEGWAHYAEELMIERGFRGGDPRYRVGVALKALMRVSRLAAAIGLHTGSMTMDDAVARFQRDAYLTPPVAQAEARRATFDPTYGRYTWGKLAILDARDRARRESGAAFSLRRFHDAILALGAPPLGLLGPGGPVAGDGEPARG